MRYIVMGMHKSGTTLLSQVLHNSGIDMGVTDSHVTYDEGNQYERKETRKLNDKLILKPSEPSFVARLCDVKSNESVRDEIESFVSGLNHQHCSWGFKDPRTCLTYPVWRDILGSHKIIAVYRNPYEVWLRYCSGGNVKRGIKALSRGQMVLRAWYEYNSSVLNVVREQQNCYISSFDNLLYSDREFERLSRFIGRPLSDPRDIHSHRNRAGKEHPAYSYQKKMSRVVFGRDIDLLWQEITELDKQLKDHSIGAISK